MLVSTAMACEPHQSRRPWPPDLWQTIPRTMRFAPLTTSYEADENTAPYLRHWALSHTTLTRCRARGFLTERNISPTLPLCPAVMRPMGPFG